MVYFLYLIIQKLFNINILSRLTKICYTCTFISTAFTIQQLIFFLSQLTKYMLHFNRYSTSNYDTRLTRLRYISWSLWLLTTGGKTATVKRLLMMIATRDPMYF